MDHVHRECGHSDWISKAYIDPAIEDRATTRRKRKAVGPAGFQPPLRRPPMLGACSLAGTARPMKLCRRLSDGRSRGVRSALQVVASTAAC